mgnify:CR=1 FL=1|jgi:oligopeptide/dipeptide ABC transporter ATP-binding protein
MSQALIRVEHLKKYFPVSGGIFRKTVGYIKAVDDISFEIKRGETLGLVGESGCGKSTVGRTLLRLYEKTAGQVFYRDQDIFNLNRKRLRQLRPKMQIVFQDPYGSLNPRMTVGNIIGEALLSHRLVGRDNYEKRVMKVMEDCGLPSYYMDRYPHEFSGGQRQRIGIARALALEPEFIVADEPVSALDVSIQSQIINLLMDLQKQHGLTYLFISHDLSVVEHISTRVAIMYLGSLVEIGPKESVFSKPLHPYTKALMSAVPVPDPTIKRERIVLEGDIPSPDKPPAGCKFHTRCPVAIAKCKSQTPELVLRGHDHCVACHLV